MKDAAEDEFDRYREPDFSNQVRDLLAQGADPTARDPSGNRSIDYALLAGYWDEAHLLLGGPVTRALPTPTWQHALP